MKYWKKIIIVIIVVLALFLPAYLKENVNISTTKEYKINKELCNLSGYHAEDLVAEWEEDMSEFYTCARANDDGTVTIELTEKQRKRLVKFFNKKITNLQKEIKEQDKKYKIKISRDYSKIDLYYNQNLNSVYAVYFIRDTAVWCAYCQVFSGNENWSHTVNIYNCDTNKMVATSKGNQDIEYDASDWEASK